MKRRLIAIVMTVAMLIPAWSTPAAANPTELGSSVPITEPPPLIVPDLPPVPPLPVPPLPPVEFPDDPPTLAPFPPVCVPLPQGAEACTTDPLPLPKPTCASPSPTSDPTTFDLPAPACRVDAYPPPCPGILVCPSWPPEPCCPELPDPCEVVDCQICPSLTGCIEPIVPPIESPTPLDPPYVCTPPTTIKVPGVSPAPVWIDPPPVGGAYVGGVTIDPPPVGPVHASPITFGGAYVDRIDPAPVGVQLPATRDIYVGPIVCADPYPSPIVCVIQPCWEPTIPPIVDLVDLPPPPRIPVPLVASTPFDPPYTCVPPTTPIVCADPYPSPIVCVIQPCWEPTIPPIPDAIDPPPMEL